MGTLPVLWHVYIRALVHAPLYVHVWLLLQMYEPICLYGVRSLAFAHIHVYIKLCVYVRARYGFFALYLVKDVRRREP